MLICKQCWIEKQFDQYYKHPLTKSWYQWRCKECILSWRKTSHELSMARQRDRNRYKTPKRKLYTIFCDMKSRCYNPLNSHYKWYWLKWIQVERKDFESFYNDVIQMYLDYIAIYWSDRKNCQMDRIDNNWNYCITNIRFCTAKENNQHNKVQ